MKKQRQNTSPSLVTYILWQQRRPDLAFWVSEMSYKCKESSMNDMRKVGKLVGLAKESDIRIKMRKLSGYELIMEMYADASMENVKMLRMEILRLGT